METVKRHRYVSRIGPMRAQYRGVRALEAAENEGWPILTKTTSRSTSR